MEQWKHLSSFAAVLTRLHVQGLLPDCVDMRTKAYWTLASALEYKIRDTGLEFTGMEYVDLRDRPMLWIPAAAEWIAIAGREIFDAALEEGPRVEAGGLWVAAGGDDVVGVERWAFWRRRLRTLEGMDALGADVREAVARAARLTDHLGLPEDDWPK